MALLPVEQAQARLLGNVRALGSETVPVEKAAGRVLAADLAALRDQPPFPASAMDGYAVRGADLAAGNALRVIGTAAAGHRFDGSVGAGEAVRIFTGAPVPPGADTILIQENATRDGDLIMPAGPETVGRFVRPLGLDFKRGDRLIEAGRRIGPREIALIAAMNHAGIEVHRRPKVSLIASGDELKRPGEPLGIDDIVSTNALSLSVLIEAAGGAAIDLGIAPDDVDAIRAKIAAADAAGADVICLLGGASVGDHDHSRAALEAEGVTLDFWKVALRPGKPLMVGGRGAVHALGLPGNPVSSLVCGLLFLVPLVRKLAGEQNVLPTEERALLGRDLGENDVRQDYLRASLKQDADGALVALPFERQDSSMLSLMAAADCLLIRPPHAPAASKGEACRIIRL